LGTDLGLSEEGFVVTAAHNLDMQGDDDEHGAIDTLFLPYKGHQFSVDMPTKGVEYWVHPEWRAAQRIASSWCDIALLQFTEPSDKVAVPESGHWWRCARRRLPG
jgi:hypothetical protein